MPSKTNCLLFNSCYNCRNKQSQNYPRSAKVGGLIQPVEKRPKSIYNKLWSNFVFGGDCICPRSLMDKARAFEARFGGSNPSGGIYFVRQKQIYSTVYYK